MQFVIAYIEGYYAIKLLCEDKMVYSYFPGCTLKNKAAELDKCARASLEVFGIKLEELSEWQCCGGTYTMSNDDIAHRLSSVRALSTAHKAGHDLVTLCSACHNVIKQVNNDMRTNDDIASKVNSYMGAERDYRGEVNVIHYLELLRDFVGFDRIAESVKKPFTGVKIGAYYGCLLLRPSSVMQMDDPENPVIMENFIRAIGATPVIYAQRNECCGGYVTLEDRAFAEKRANIITENAEANDADMLITACPLCAYNLTVNNENHLPIRYFTELLYEALGIGEEL